MTSAPFEGSRTKILNARDHIARTEKLFSEYQRAHPLAIVHVPSEPTEVAIRFEPSAPLPALVAAVAGDAIHNLRSALDIMAGDVVALSGGRSKGVYFPFADSAAEYDAMIIAKKFNRASSEARCLIKTFKPYHGGGVLLRAIHDLDVADKHKFLIPTRHHALIPRIEFGNSVMIDTIVGDCFGADFAFPKHMPIKISPAYPLLTFAPGGPLGGEQALVTLHRMADLTGRIVEAFATLFRRA